MALKIQEPLQESLSLRLNLKKQAYRVYFHRKYLLLCTVHRNTKSNRKDNSLTARIQQNETSKFKSNL